MGVELSLIGEHPATEALARACLVAGRADGTCSFNVTHEEGLYAVDFFEEDFLRHEPAGSLPAVLAPP